MPAFLAILFLFFGAPYAFAEDLNFEEAVQLWLLDDDERSLPALAKLAQNGDAKARILLSRIETQDFGPSAFRRELSVEEQRELFRPEKVGKFHRNWLWIEADRGHQLAKLLHDAKKPDVQPELIKALIAAGEPEASYHPTRMLALYGAREVKQAYLEEDIILPQLRPYMRYLTGKSEQVGDGIEVLRHITGQAIETPDAEDEAMARLLALGEGWWASIADENRHFNAVSNWVLSNPATLPISDICYANCAGEERKCAMGLFAMTGGYFEAIRLDSPVENYISQVEFLNSDRARGMTLRRAAFQRSETDGPVIEDETLQRYNKCLAGLIQDERKN